MSILVPWAGATECSRCIGGRGESDAGRHYGVWIGKNIAGATSNFLLAFPLTFIIIIFLLLLRHARLRQLLNLCETFGNSCKPLHTHRESLRLRKTV